MISTQPVADPRVIADPRVTTARHLSIIALLLVLVLVLAIMGWSVSPAGCENLPKTHVEFQSTETAHPDPSPQQTIKAGTSGAQLKGQVQENQELDALNARLGFTTKPFGKQFLPAHVSKVVAGSPVAKREIAAGDKLVGEGVNDDGSVTLTMEHAGQGMRFTIKTSELEAWAGATKTATPLKTGAEKTMLNVKVVDTSQKKPLRSIIDVLENHDLGLIIDHSGSMHTQDCPGGTSRWDWCCQQSSQLAQAAAQAASSIDVSVFNSDYQTYRKVSPSQIPQIFAANRPAGGTEPAYAVQEQLENYFNSSRPKPLTIVIVTDGLPNRPANIATVLAEESKKIRYQGEVTITFLLISDRVDDSRLRGMLGLTPGSNINNGGFVDIVPFSTLVSIGIKQALFEDLKEIRLATDPNKPSRASQTTTGIAAGYARQNGLPPYQPSPSHMRVDDDIQVNPGVEGVAQPNLPGSPILQTTHR